MYDFVNYSKNTKEVLSVINKQEHHGKAQGISGVLTEASAWHSKNTHPGAQIDLGIDRNDNTISICEMKYYDGIYEIDQNAGNSIENKVQTFINETKTKKTIMTVLITPFGINHTARASCYHNIITLNDLFRETLQN